MPNKLSSIERAANPKLDSPDSSELVEALLYLEKLAKKEKTEYQLSDLVGCWNLRFITGTKKSRKKAGVVLGAGKYIPKLIKIQIAYTKSDDSSDKGRVVNSVRVGLLDLSVSGPIKFLAPKNILVFDFTYLTLKIFGWKIYDNYLKNGAIAEREFEQKKLATQAFFSYFLVRENTIAARGKGGGLALWIKNE